MMNLAMYVFTALLVKSLSFGVYALDGYPTLTQFDLRVNDEYLDVADYRRDDVTHYNLSLTVKKEVPCDSQVHFSLTPKINGAYKDKKLFAGEMDSLSFVEYVHGKASNVSSIDYAMKDIWRCFETPDLFRCPFKEGVTIRMKECQTIKRYNMPEKWWNGTVHVVNRDTEVYSLWLEYELQDYREVDARNNPRPRPQKRTRIRNASRRT